MDVIVSDLTYRRWNYICLILDLFNREIVGYVAEKNKNSELIFKAFSIIKYDLKNINIFHTDRKNEFKNKIINELLNKFDIKRLLSKKRCPYDNAVAEVEYKIIKIEFVFNSFEKLELFEYVNWYNNIRIHGSLNYLKLVEYKNTILIRTI